MFLYFMTGKRKRKEVCVQTLEKIEEEHNDSFCTSRLTGYRKMFYNQSSHALLLVCHRSLVLVLFLSLLVNNGACPTIVIMISIYH